ncbi:MAG: hypothetical protein K9K35_16085 [Rhodoferax sp.]|nr:hypothetical protein [Rhodoferax sp.]
MFTNNPFESAAKALLNGAGKLSSDDAQSAAKEMMDSLRAWGDLVQTQAQAAQVASVEAVEDFKSVRDPMAAFEAFRSNTQKMLALSATHLQETMALSIEQFNAGVDLLQERHPTPDAFAPVAQGMKKAASAVESGMLAALNTGIEATGTKPAAKKSRAR